MERFNPQYMHRHSELRLLSLAWKARTTSNVAFVAVDTEFSNGRGNFTHVVELGLSYVQFRPQNCGEAPVIKTRNLIVKNVKHLRKMVPFSLDKPEYVEREDDLKVLLDGFFEDLIEKNDWVVFLAHDALEDLNRLQRACSWRPPRAVVSLDTQRIWYALRHRTNGGSLGVACESYGIAFDPKEHHSAGHDAKHTLELGLHKAKHSVDRSTSSSPAPPNIESAHDNTATRPLRTPTSYQSNPSCAPTAKTDSPVSKKRKRTKVIKQQEAALQGKSGPYEPQNTRALDGITAFGSSQVHRNAADDLPGYAESPFHGKNLDLGGNANRGLKPSAGMASALWPRGAKRQRSVSESPSTDGIPRQVGYTKQKLESSAKTHHGSNKPIPGDSLRQFAVATATEIVDLTADTPPRPGFITNLDPVDLTRE